MSLDIQHNLKNQQQLSMTPQLQQAIKILQLSKLELEEFLSQQVIENPMLETVDEDNYFKKEPYKPLNEENYYKNRPEFRTIETNKHSKSKDEKEEITEQNNYENFVPYETTLHTFLLQQIGTYALDSQEKKIALLIIDSITEKGYLNCSLKKLSQQENLEEDILENILRIIQSLEPSGVGARSLSECLSLQIYFLNLENGILEKIAENYLDLAAKKDFATIAKKLNTDTMTIRENIKKLSALNFYPGLALSRKKIDYITPDLSVENINGEWEVFLEKNIKTSIRINENYKNILTSVKKKEERSYIKNKTKEASWLIRSLEQRDKTLLKVMKAIVKYQKDFFTLGIKFLKPLVLKEIAQETELHESTISRSTSNKYVNTPRGTFELKFFFTSKIKSSSGPEVANETVKFFIKNIIKEEDSRVPLTDSKITEIFKEKGITIARRTVTKYREQLNIPSSPKRKVHS